MTAARLGAAGALLVVLVVTGVLMRGSDDDPTPMATGGDHPRTVFVGDSISRGLSPVTYTPDEDYSWVRHAATDRRSPWRLEANVSTVGHTLGDMEASFASEVLALDPGAVVILGGTNDVLRRLPVEESMAALRAMVTAAQDAGAKVWVIAPPPLDPGYGLDLGALVDAERALADELGVPFVDVREQLAERDGGWPADLSTDGVHPTQDGARALADAILDQVGR